MPESSRGMVPQPEQPDKPISPYVGASTLDLTDAEKAAVMEEFAESELEIREHDGIVYVPGPLIRLRYCKIFGPGQVAMVPRRMDNGKGVQRQENLTNVLGEWAMMIRGHFVDQKVGDGQYIESNRSMTLADSAAAAETNAFARAAQALGTGLYVKPRAFQRAWKRKFAIAVSVQGKTKPCWRRKDDPMLVGEMGHDNRECPCDSCEKDRASGKVTRPTPEVRAPQRKGTPPPQEVVTDAEFASEIISAVESVSSNPNRGGFYGVKLASDHQYYSTKSEAVAADAAGAKAGQKRVRVRFSTEQNGDYTNRVIESLSVEP